MRDLPSANITAGLLVPEPEPVAACCSSELKDNTAESNNVIKMWSVPRRRMRLITRGPVAANARRVPGHVSETLPNVATRIFAALPQGGRHSWSKGGD